MNKPNPVENIDISEDFIDELSVDILKSLLQDHTKSKAKGYSAIFWATDNYKTKGPGFSYFDEIKPESITRKNGKVIQPRVVKERVVQIKRSRDMAEVFTPAWVCNAQNNLVDNVWFGREGVFNNEMVSSEGVHSWVAEEAKIEFPKGKSWKDYVLSARLEITCGEAPYIVSRYDAASGMSIPIKQRIGLLDRKLRVVGENTTDELEWFEWAEKAYKSTYGYEWQGDNLLLAREALLMTLVDYHKAKFCKKVSKYKEIPLDILNNFAVIISWNFWQMDGLKGVIPCSCEAKKESSFDLFSGETINKVVCEGCEKNDIKKHNGIYCKIMDWNAGKKIKFIEVMK